MRGNQYHLSKHICFYPSFGIQGIISLLFSKTSYTFTNTEIVLLIMNDYESQGILIYEN